MPLPRSLIGEGKRYAARPIISAIFVRPRRPGRQGRFSRTSAIFWIGRYRPRADSGNGTHRRPFRGPTKCVASLKRWQRSMLIWRRAARSKPRPRACFKRPLRTRSRTSDKSRCCGAWQERRCGRKIITSRKLRSGPLVRSNPLQCGNSLRYFRGCLRM